MTNFEKLNEDIEALMIGNNSNMKKPDETVSVANPVYANAIEEEEKLEKRTREQMKNIESSNDITPKENGVGKQIKNEYTKQLSLDEGLFGEINEGPGAGYSIKSEGYSVEGNVKSFKVIEREPLLLVDVDVDMNGTVDDFEASGYYSGTGEQHDLSIHCDRVIVDLSDEDIEEEQIDNDFLKSFIIDYLADGRGDIIYGGGWSHVTYDGTVTEITDDDNSWLNNYVKANIVLTDKENIEATDRLVDGYGYDTFYEVVVDGVGEGYFETESEAIEYAENNGYDSVRIIYVTELFNGDEEIESGDTIWEKEDDVDESIKNNESENENKMRFSEMNESLSDEFKDIIGKHFKYSFDSEFLDVVDDVLGRIDDFSDTDDIIHAIDDGLIYDSDQWKVLKHYCTATEANWEVAYNDFENDILEIANEIAESQEDDEDELDDDVDEGLNEAKEKMIEDLPDTVYELVYDACFPDGVKNYKPILFKGLGNGYDEERFYVKGLNDWDIGVAVKDEEDAKFVKGVADTLKLPYEYKETSLLSDGLTGVAIIRMDEKTANIPTDEYLEKIGISGKVRNDPNKRK